MAFPNFPKTFAISKLKKGFFPLKLNIPSNQNYVGAYAGNEYYLPKFKKSSKELEFNAWYYSESNHFFDFKKEFYILYCWSDVELLTE